MSVAETFILDTTINLAVFGDMELRLSTQYIAREGDHNSAIFKIRRQPAALDSLVCRAEIETAAGKNYYLVADGEFALTQDISVPGPGRMQLVYSDGVDVMVKTSIAHFTVMPSINAVDPSDPDFQDGLAQLQSAAFTAVVDPPPGGDVATFFNINGSPVAVLRFPVAAVGGDLTEARADTLYLRLSGALPMQGSVGISGPNRGITWEDSGRQGALYSTGTQLVMRLPEGDPPFVIEPNSGSAGLRSPVLTQQAGDTRYVQPPALDAYLLRAGGQMSGPLISAMGTGLTNPGLGIGDNATGFYRAGASLLLSVSGALYTQYLASPPSVMVTVPLNMATNQITNVGNPDTAAAGNSMAMPRSYADARYLQLAVGGIVTGPVQITQTPQIPTDATNKGYVDARPAPNSRTYLTNTVELLNTTAQILIDQLYPVANNNPRTITVTVFPTFEGGTPSQFYDLIYTCSVAPLIEAKTTVYPTAGAYMASPVRFAATVTPVGNAIQVQIAVRLNATATGPLTIVGSSTDKRSYVTIEEQQN